MTKSSLWAIYCRKYPQFAEEGEITLTTRGLRKLFETTWDTALYDGEDKDSMPENAGVEQLKRIFGFK